MARLALHPGRAIPVHCVRTSVGGMAPATFACVFVSALGDRDAIGKRADPRPPVVRCSASACSITCCRFRCRAAVEFAGTSWGCNGNRSHRSLYASTVAVEPHNLMYCFLGVLIGNWSACCRHGPAGDHLDPVAADLRIKAGRRHPDVSGISMARNTAGAICSFCQLPCHPPHAVTCLAASDDQEGKGGVRVGIK